MYLIYNYFWICLISLFVLVGQSRIAYSQQEGNPEIDQILIGIDTLETDSLKVWTLFHLAGSRLRYSQASRKLLDVAGHISRESDYARGHANYLYALGNYYFYNSMPDSSEHFLNQALDTEVSQKDRFLHSQILATQASLQKSRGSVSQSLETALRAKEILVTMDTTSLDLVRKTKRKGQISILDNSIANLYLAMEDHPSALRYYTEAYELFSELNDQASASVIMGNIGELYLNMSEYDNALEALQKSLQLKETAGVLRRSVAMTQFNIGRVYMRKGLPDTALIRFNETIQIFQEEKNVAGLMEGFLERGLLYLEYGRYDAAENDCKQTLEISTGQKNPDMESRACDCLYRIYKETGNTAASLDYYEQHVKLRDSLFNAENVRQLTQLEMQYNFDREREIQVLESEARQVRYERNIRISIAGTLISLIIAFLLYYLFRTRKKANEILAQKNEQVSKALSEKEILLKEIHHRVKNNLQVISSLLSLQSRQLESPQAREAIQSGRNRVKSMALIHQKLYQDEDLVGVETAEYIDKLTNSLVNSYKVDNTSIKILTYVDPMKLDVDTLVPIGLILNELISNSLKYAFKNQESGVLEIHLRRHESDILLKVSDNGQGLPADFSIESSKSLGYRLVKAFSEKLGASLTIGHSPSGTHASMIIPNPHIWQNDRNKSARSGG